MEREPPPTVLVVEDDHALSEALCSLLECEGCQTLTALDGMEAIRLACEGHPDLLTLDLHLPDVDGHYVLEAIHHEAGLEELPVIIISAGHYRPADDDHVVGIVPKPFEVHELGLLVHQALDLRPAQDSAARA